MISVESEDNDSEANDGYKEESGEESDGSQEESSSSSGSSYSGGSGSSVVDYATQFVGNPYVWGGTSLTNGADCSGFVQSVYNNFGVSCQEHLTNSRTLAVRFLIPKLSRVI